MLKSHCGQTRISQLTPLIQQQLEEKEEEPVQTKLLADHITLLAQGQVEREEEGEQQIQKNACKYNPS